MISLEGIQSLKETLIWTSVWLLNKVSSSQLKCLYAECKHMSLDNVQKLQKRITTSKIITRRVLSSEFCAN